MGILNIATIQVGVNSDSGDAGILGACSEILVRPGAQVYQRRGGGEGGEWKEGAGSNDEKSLVANEGV